MAVLLPGEYVRCRTWGHAWEPYAVPVRTQARQRWGSRYGLKCLRCGTERYDVVDTRGVLVARQYVYAEQYLVHGDDKPTTEELRLDVLQQLTGPQVRRRAPRAG
jgi:hypothetical protein